MGNVLNSLLETDEDRRQRAEEFRVRETIAQMRRVEVERQREEERIQREYQQLLRREEEKRLRRVQQLKFEEEERKRIEHQEAQWRKSLTYALNNAGIFPWPCTQMKTLFTDVELSEIDSEFYKVKALFDNTTRNQGFQVLKIEQCRNPILYGQFLLKKEELQSRYGHVTIELLFHGTKSFNIDQISENNFDWRRHGSSIGNRYGKGVSFSPIATYASHYCDKRTNIKIMFLCQVLVSESCIGNPNMVLPDVYDRYRNLRYDTAIKNDNNKRSVIVKFSDHEFYPLYKIHFQGQPNKSVKRVY